MILGIISLIAWFISLFGAPTSIVGLILGLVARKSESKKAKAGIIMSIIGLILTIINAALAMYLAASGKIPLNK